MMADKFWIVFGMATFLIPLLVAFTSVFILRLTLDRRVREALPDDKYYGCYMDLYGGIGRAITFGYACAFQYYNNSPQIRDNYNNIDIQKFANPTERLFGILLSYSVVLCCVFLVVSLLLEIFGVIDLSE